VPGTMPPPGHTHGRPGPCYRGGGSAPAWLLRVQEQFDGRAIAGWSGKVAVWTPEAGDEGGQVGLAYLAACSRACPVAARGAGLPRAACPGQCRHRGPVRERVRSSRVVASGLVKMTTRLTILPSRTLKSSQDDILGRLVLSNVPS